MVINPVIHCNSQEYQETSENALRLVPKSRTDLNVIHKENDVIETGELANVKEQLKLGKRTCLIMTVEHPRAYEIR